MQVNKYPFFLGKIPRGLVCQAAGMYRRRQLSGRVEYSSVSRNRETGSLSHCHVSAQQAATGECWISSTKLHAFVKTATAKPFCASIWAVITTNVSSFRMVILFHWTKMQQQCSGKKDSLSKQINITFPLFKGGGNKNGRLVRSFFLA